MKYLVLFSFLLFFLGAAFALDGYSNLIAISSMDAQAHICKPPCTYPNKVQIPTQYFANCSDTSSARILGLSSSTNAHAEQMSSSFYTDTNICLSSTVFTSYPNLCYYSLPGADCSVGYNCSFGLSGNTNAHPSMCGVFAANEVKFCCIFLSNASCPINLSITKAPADYNHPADINFLYNCLGTTSNGIPVDLVITDSLGYKKTILFSKNCVDAANWQTVNSSEIASAIGGDISHKFRAVLKARMSPCTSGDANFTMFLGASTGTGAGTVPIITIPTTGVDCNIQSLGAQNIVVDSNVNVSYSCYYPDPIGIISITNPYGVVVAGPINVPCNTSLEYFRNLRIDSTNSSLPTGVYTAKLSVGFCTREFFFSATAASKPQSIPDIGLLPVLISLLVVVFFAFGKKKRK